MTRHPACIPLKMQRAGYERFKVKQECSFLKKRTKKLLRFETGAGHRSATATQRFFASFFQKRSSFLTLAFSRYLTEKRFPL
jgi:hypothetical protein